MTDCRKAFDRFRAEKIAKYGARDVKRLLRNEGIVRNRLKIAAAIQNAKAFLGVRQEFGSFDVYLWRFVGSKPKQNRWRQADPESLANDGQGAGADRGIRCDEPRLAAAWIQICGLDNLLCVDASDRDGERSFSNLSATCRTRRQTIDDR